MATAAALASAAANFLPIPGAGLVGQAAGVLPKVISVIDPGKARDAARIQRRDFFLNAGKAGSVIATRYLINGEANVYTVKEKNEYKDGVKEMEQKRPEVLAQARALGPLWSDAVGNGDMLDVGQQIATELGQKLNVPQGSLGVNTESDIEKWAQQFGYKIRQDTSVAVAQLGSGVVSAASSAIAPAGSKNKQSVLLPTNKTTLIIAAVVAAALLYFALRKR